VKAKIAHIVSSTPKASVGSTYYYELDPTYYSVTSSTFVGQLMGLLGLKSIADSATGVAASGGYPQLSAEFILKADPTYIFLADTICCKANATTVAARAGWSALSAVQNGRIIGLNDDIASRWGPRVTVLLQDAANAIKASKAAPAS
jgi:iron complex transport system substrate-binding protein